jgi:hypothetical protein
MTTYSAVLPTAVYTTAGIKDAMNSVATLMTNAGWVKQADTGEIVIANVVYTSTSGTDYGWQIWYLNDTQHATYPIYIKIDYFMGATNQFGWRFVTGYATDGAGNITGYKYPSTGYVIGDYGAVTQWGTATNASKACSLDGYGAWILAPSATGSAGQHLIVTREWDNSTGAVKTGGNYTIMWRYGLSSTNCQVSVNRAASTTTDMLSASNFRQCFMYGNEANSQNAGTTDIFRHWQAYPTFTRSGVSCTFHVSEITVWSTFSCQVLTGGSARTWLATNRFQHAAYGTSTTAPLAILWE